MNLSKTQLMNYATMISGVVMFFLTMANVKVEENQITFIIFALLTVGFSAYNFYQRFRKGDLTIGGARK